MDGNIHSIETFGTVDGPGIRYVVFTQGCLMRCQFCHNADTWEIGTGKQMTVSEIVQDVQHYLPFIQSSGGGITVSGGEPLLQLPFLIELFKACKSLGIHTALDSSGGCYSAAPAFQEQIKELIQYTDLVLLDLKHINRKKHINLTGMPNDHILDFARFLADHQVPVWIRHVLVPGISDIDDDLTALGTFIGTLANVQKVEVLPYHKLGVYKWEALGLDYPLNGVEPPSADRVENAYRLLTAHLQCGALLQET
ncbi:pyruvate formate-lyase-activating protein [Bacillus haynesii]|uniref:pyruvate formate-lyase-activating protein n=1 Tax=Bacillus TaxID=1386 RepID=UPI0012B6C8B0|nr:pyruvate formate-lyase-activating protein [Bacillus haynesii]TWK15984.1 Pyruvate formate-lyase-activating enzyme [Bacillus licheniformis]MCY7801197.1 pyruvate formate-lyase-activating protein [Bacillus haynesii]MCY7835924.1 pyruvate formate-lyase-activating protein [Bacillus haynesii]MCY7844617.1 pyruvate formate-lyase-activating protein [Bacillus haynesii]MCY7965884.1 pyruvate formate-lyase-activating protein [Bacillus haynesii]